MKTLNNLFTALALAAMTFLQIPGATAQLSSINLSIPEGWVEASNWQQPYQQTFGTGVSSNWIGSQMAEGAILLTNTSTKALMLVQEEMLEDAPSSKEAVESSIIGGAGTYLTPITEANAENDSYSVKLRGTIAGRPVDVERISLASLDNRTLLTVLIISPSSNRIGDVTKVDSRKVIASAVFDHSVENLAIEK